jgi:hypothetical protein
MKPLIKRGLLIAALFAVVALVTFNHTSASVQPNDEQALWAAIIEQLNAAQAQQPAQPATQQAAPAAGQEPTAEQIFKNIQVFKGVPAWQVDSMMHLFNTSLGVRCDFCHVRNGNQFEFDKDDKQGKKVARKMIEMTMAINKNSFNNRTQVTCYTCHQGHENPVAIPSLPAPIINPPPQPQPNAAATPGANPAPGAKPAEAMPTADQVLEKYVQAVGGKAAIEKLKSQTLKGTYQPQRGNSDVPLEVVQSGDKIFITVTTPQGSNTRAFDGTKGWSKAGNQMREMETGDVMSIKDLAVAFDVLKLREPFPKFNFRGKDKIGDREAYILVGALPDKRRVRLYFDVQTGLLVREQIFNQLPVAIDPTQFDFEDYRDVDGVKMPFTVRTLYAEPGFSGTRKFTEIKHNVKVEDTQFAAPQK